MEHHRHEIVKCSCGNIISHCHCCGKQACRDRETRVIERGCQDCCFARECDNKAAEIRRSGMEIVDQNIQPSEQPETQLERQELSLQLDASELVATIQDWVRNGMQFPCEIPLAVTVKNESQLSDGKPIILGTSIFIIALSAEEAGL